QGMATGATCRDLDRLSGRVWLTCDSRKVQGKRTDSNSTGSQNGEVDRNHLGTTNGCMPTTICPCNCYRACIGIGRQSREQCSRYGGRCRLVCREATTG